MAERRAIRAIPLDLAVAIGLGASLYLVRAIVELVGDREMFFGTRWHLFEYGAGAAQSVLVVAGLAELWRRARGRLAVLLGCATVGRAISALWILGWPLINRVVFELDHDAIDRVFTIIGIAWFAVDSVVLVALAVAARAWRSRLGVVALVVLVAQMAPQMPYLGGWIWEHIYAHPSGRTIFELASSILALAWLVLFGMIAAQVPAVPAPARAARACRRAAWSVYARIWVAAALAVLAIGTVHSPSFAVTLLYVTAIGSVLAMGGFVSGLLGLGHAGVPGLPVGRLYVAAFVTLWWLAIQLDQAYVMYRGLSGSWLESSDANDLAAWSVIGPLAMTLAIGFGGSALRRLASDGLTDLATSRLAWYVALGAAAALIPLASTPETVSGFVLMALASIGCSIGSLVALARLFRDAAERVALASAADVF